jgi:transcription elongation factor Elf1
MGPRRVTVSCPACGSEHEGITVDEAEEILFNGCEDCQELA